jgi:hypothetical protein
MIPAVNVIDRLGSDRDAHNEALRSHGVLRVEEQFDELTFVELFDRIEALTAKDRITECGLRRWGGGLSELDLIRSIRNVPAGAMALLPVIWCLAVLRANEWPESDSNAFEGRLGFGWHLIGVHAVVIPEVKRFIKDGWHVRDVMGELAMRTVDQHLRVSWSRMAVDTRHDVALLIVDGTDWRSRTEKHVQDFRPGRTNSRLGQAINWLHQLQLVQESGLTQFGANLYQRLCDTLIAGSGQQ